MVRLRLVQVEEDSRVLLNPRTGDLVEFASRVVQEYEGEQYPCLYRRGRIHRMQSTREGISFIVSLSNSSRLLEIKPSEIIEIQGIYATWSEEHHGFILKDDGRRLKETTPEEAQG